MADVERLWPDSFSAQIENAGQYESLREAVDTIRFHIREPSVWDAILRQFGSPPWWRLAATPEELLPPTVAGAAALARELALGELSAGAPARRRPKP